MFENARNFLKNLNIVNNQRENSENTYDVHTFKFNNSSIYSNI